VTEFNALPGSSKAGEAFLATPAAAAAEEEEDVDLFGEDEEADAEAERVKAERVAAYNAKKANKPKTIAKVCLIIPRSTDLRKRMCSILFLAVCRDVGCQAVG